MKRALFLLTAVFIVLPGGTQTIPTPVPGDVNGDGYVDSEDLLILQENWHQGSQGAISDDVRTVHNDPNIAYESSDGEQFVFTYTGSGEPDLQTGNIIAGVENGGYLRRVTDVIVDGQQVTVKTEQASLVEAIDEGSLSETLEGIEWTVTKSKLRHKGVAPGMKVRDINASLADLSGTRLYENGAFTVDITSGSIEFTPGFDIAIEIDDGSVELFRTALYGQLDLDMDFQASIGGAELDASAEVTLVEYQHIAVQAIGFVPVVEVITLTFLAGASIDVETAMVLETGFDASYSARLGAEYKDGDWSPLTQEPSVFNAHEPVWTVSNARAEAGVYVRPQASIQFYAVAGPLVALKAYGRFVGEVTLEPSCAWELTAGVDGIVGLDVIGAEVLDELLPPLEWSQPLAEWELASGSCSGSCEVPPTPTSTPTPGDFTGEAITVPLAGLAEGAKLLEMVLIQPGTFTMGSPSDERGRYSWEWSAHDVTITEAFYLGKYEVTQAQWEAVMGSNPAGSDGVGNDYPAHTVSWNDCQTFVETLNGMGLGMFRLPTEAEWEYACRAGTDTRFSFGDALECDDSCGFCDLQDQYMVWCGNDNGRSEEVGSKLPNPWGCTTCTGISGSGARIGGKTHRHVVPRLIQKALHRARTVSDAAAAGTTTPSIAGWRIAVTTRPTPAAASSVCGF